MMINKLMENVYPFLFDQLEAIAVQLKVFENQPGFLILRSHINNIRQELVDMYFYERQELFPQILKLQEEKKKSPSCQPFKNVGPYYRSACNHLNSLQLALRDIAAQELAVPEAPGILALAMAFETYIRHVQKTKERQLYAPFKSCKNCKLPVE